MTPSLLSTWQWILLAAVPPALVLLYFLKLKRQPLEVPSTLLWHRATEDLHVNSLWQRLRKSLLLFLQLLMVGLLILACRNPAWWTQETAQERLIFLVDQSASMSSTDTDITRLEVAKQRVGQLIDQMQPGKVAMIIAFSNRAQVIQPYTANQQLLRRQLESIQPTSRPSDLAEALRVADGLANPHTAGDQALVDPLPAALYVVSDGGFAPADSFSLGHLEPHYLSVGKEAPQNVAILAFHVARNPLRHDQLEAFARLENFGKQPTVVTLRLFLDDRLTDARRVALPKLGKASAVFELTDLSEGELRVEVAQADDFALDNVAYAPINRPRRGAVLCATSGNSPLRRALTTRTSRMLVEVTFVEPDFLTSEEYLQESAVGSYDLIIFDRCLPSEMPASNTFFLGVCPPDDRWALGPWQEQPQVTDVDVTHPISHNLQLDDVFFPRGASITIPSGGRVLIDSDLSDNGAPGALLAIAPRQGFEDLVLGTTLVGGDSQGELQSWARRRSFPLFVDQLLRYLAGKATEKIALAIQPGEPVELQTTLPSESIDVLDPSGDRHHVPRGVGNTYLFQQTGEPGIYEVRLPEALQVERRFAVNLFDRQESDIRARPTISTRGTDITGQSELLTSSQIAWKWLLAGALLVLVIEWWVYSHRLRR